MDIPSLPRPPLTTENPDARRLPDRNSPREIPPEVKRGAGRDAKLGLLIALVGAGMILASFLLAGPGRAEISESSVESPGIANLGGGGADEIRAASDGDLVHALAGDDELYGGPGDDVLIGGSGDDFIEAAGGGRDHISCGPGRDFVNADATDTISASCETVYAPTRPTAN